MANRYTYQFNGSFKPKMSQIEGFVSIGTGGLVNSLLPYPLGIPTAGSLQTGVPYGLLPAQATAGVPTGWHGGFSGTWGLYNAGVAGIQRVATGLYAVQLQDDWVRLDSVQCEPLLGTDPTIPTSLSAEVLYHTVGLGNSIATGGMTAPLGPGNDLKNMIFIQFSAGSLTDDLPEGGGFFLDIRVRDGLEGPQ